MKNVSCNNLHITIKIILLQLVGGSYLQWRLLIMRM